MAQTEPTTELQKSTTKIQLPRKYNADNKAPELIKLARKRPSYNVEILENEQLETVTISSKYSKTEEKLIKYEIDPNQIKGQGITCNLDFDFSSTDDAMLSTVILVFILVISLGTFTFLLIRGLRMPKNTRLVSCNKVV